MISYRIIVSALFAFVLAALAACGGSGGGASSGCVESPYHVPGMSDEDKMALMQPIAEMDDYARLRSIKAISRMASTDDCADFVEELDEWSETPEGEEWYAANGEQIAPAVLGFLGTLECRDSFPTSRTIVNNLALDTGRTIRGDIRQQRVGEKSLSKIDDFRYEITWNLLIPETYGGLTDLMFDCVLEAEVDTRSRTVTGIEVLQGEFYLYGQLLERHQG